MVLVVAKPDKMVVVRVLVCRMEDHATGFNWWRVFTEMILLVRPTFEEESNKVDLVVFLHNLHKSRVVDAPPE